MAWVAEILRKKHRICVRCRLGPTHVYDPPIDRTDAEIDPEGETGGDPLCNGCLASELERAFSAYGARCVLFEPSLGPDSIAFRPLSEDWPEAHRRALEAALAGMATDCTTCGNPARFLWVPVDPDANLWPDDWLAGLADGSLRADRSLCGGCAAGLLMASIEKRGLFFDAIIPPRDADGILCGWEI